MHIHLDPVGGIAGDMFVGAVLDLHPEFAEPAMAAVRLAGLDDAVALAHIPFSDGILSGSRFDVVLPPAEHTHEHRHVHWTSLRARLEQSPLAPTVLARTLDIFSLLAEAEARVHGKSIETVSFHEVGAWDSIADIVAAAYVIDALGTCSWSIGTIPLGSGRVDTDHGKLPVPAPATVLLLEGFACFDDGSPGERVTPTGAAIVRHLKPATGIGSAAKTLKHTGHGFGTRRFTGMSNVLRVLEFESEDDSTLRRDQVSVIEFEIDDQTAEDLALGLERLRATDGVLDVVQMPVTGKQGRVFAGVRILLEPHALQTVIRRCFHETTTIGLRLSMSDRITLPRHEVTSAGGVRSKIAERPAGASVKAELRDLAGGDGHAAREALRRVAETEALGGTVDEQ